MLLKSRKHMTDNITLGMDRLLVETCFGNILIIGGDGMNPIKFPYVRQRDQVLSDCDGGEFSDEEGEEWKLSD